MIKWLLDEFLLILYLNIPYDCMKFISYASYRNNPRKEVQFWPKIKILVALDIKNWGFQLKRVGGGSRDKKMQENLEKLTVDHDCWLGGRPVEEPVDRFVGARNLKSLLTLHFSPVLLHSLKSLHIPASRIPFWPDFGPIAGCGLDFGMPWG